jgi:hypothetical protein
MSEILNIPQLAEGRRILKILHLLDFWPSTSGVVDFVICD